MNTANSHQAKLSALVSEICASDPFERDGYKWAKRPQKFYVDKLGISVETLRRIIKQPPFVRQRALVDDRSTTLLRIGTPGSKTPHHVQNILAVIWRSKTGRPVNRKGYGCLAGLVQLWGTEHAPEILKTVLNNWPGFMCDVKIEIDLSGKEYHRFYKYPTPTVILCFNKVAVYLHVQEVQEKTNCDPAALAGLKYPEGLSL